MASALRDAGIEAFVFDTARTTLQWEAPAVIAPYQVHVRRADAERAAELLSQNAADSVDIDWSEIDVGEPEDATAARISSQIDAPWQGNFRVSKRPIRDAAFRLTGVGILMWLGVILVSLIVSAIVILIKIF